MQFCAPIISFRNLARVLIVRSVQFITTFVWVPYKLSVRVIYTLEWNDHRDYIECSSLCRTEKISAMWFTFVRLTRTRFRTKSSTLRSSITVLYSFGTFLLVLFVNVCSSLLLWWISTLRGDVRESVESVTNKEKYSSMVVVSIAHSVGEFVASLWGRTLPGKVLVWFHSSYPMFLRRRDR